MLARPGSVGAVVGAIDLPLRESERRNLGKPTRTGQVAVVYGPQTTARVKVFQRRNGLLATGAVDERTDALLRPKSKLQAGTQTIGRSVKGRALQVRVVGDLKNAKRRVLVLGCIHGNECAGLPILSSVGRSTPPKGVAYVLHARPNPDGAVAGTRHNARRVDLNRNAIGWCKAHRPGHVYYPGPGALSEPESLALHDLIRSMRPTAFISFHQALRCVDYAGRGGHWAPVYARICGLPVKVLPAHRGSIATWLGRRYPSMVSLTVELSRPAPRAMLDRNIKAVKYVAARH